MARIAAIIGVVTPGLLSIGACQLDGAGTPGALAHRNDQQICRTALASSSSQPAWESAARFQPSVREAQARGLKVEDCAALLAAEKEAGKTETGKVEPGPAPVAKNPAATAQPGGSLKPHEMAVALQWEGVAPLAVGVMRTSSLADKGDIAVSFGDPKVECVGQWMWARGKYRTANLPEGTWSVGCNNGLSAAGIYKSPKPGTGTGSGVDLQGRKITFTFSNDGL